MIATFIGCFRLNSYYLRVVNAVEGPLSTRATLPRKSQLKAKSLTELRTWRRPSPSCLMRANTRHRHEAVACCMRLSDKAPRGSAQSRLRKSAQYDKWSFCLTAGKIGPRIRRDDEQTSTPEPHTGFQGEGGAGRRQGRPSTGSAGGAAGFSSDSPEFPGFLLGSDAGTNFSDGSVSLDSHPLP